MESIAKSQPEAELLEFCERTLQAAGFRVVDIDYRVSGRSLVRLFIERVPAGEPPSLEECAKASRLLSAAFDAEDRIPGAYDLEVSSPGLDRRLRLRSDFEKWVGGEVRLKLAKSIEGLGGQVTGKLERVEGATVIIQAQKKAWPIPLAGIRQANLVWRF